MDTALGMGETTKGGGMGTGSAVEGRKRLGSMHYWESWGQNANESWVPEYKKDQLYCVSKLLGLAMNTEKKSADFST